MSLTKTTLSRKLNPAHQNRGRVPQGLVGSQGHTSKAMAFKGDPWATIMSTTWNTAEMKLTTDLRPPTAGLGSCHPCFHKPALLGPLRDYEPPLSLDSREHLSWKGWVLLNYKQEIVREKPPLSPPPSPKADSFWLFPC